nr:hypothetical protein [Devosia aurantiaca]
MAALHGIIDGMKTRARGEPADIAAGMQIDDDMNMRPDGLPHEAGNAVGDAAQGRRGACTIDKGPVEIGAVIEGGIARPRTESGGVEHRDKNDTPGDLADVDLAQQVANDHRPLIFVAVVGPKDDHAFPGFGGGPDHDGQRYQVVAPNRVVFERHKVVATAGALEIELMRFDDLARHGQSSFRASHGARR